jgi:GDP-L-fucose synthase
MIKPDVIIHTAAKVGGIKYNVDNSYSMLFENLILDLNLIRAALESQTSQMIYFSSSCIYPLNAKKPFEVDSIFKGEFEPTNEFYAIAKSTMSSLLKGIDKNEAIDFKVFVLSNLYGKYDNFTLDNAHAVSAAFAKILNAKVNNIKEVEIWGTGTPRREFTLAKDVAKFVLNSLPYLQEFPAILNLGTGCDYSISEIYQIISGVLKYEVHFTYNNSMPDGVISKLMNSSVAVNNFRWQPEVDLSVGIASELLSISRFHSN